MRTFLTVLAVVAVVLVVIFALDIGASSGFDVRAMVRDAFTRPRVDTSGA